MRVYTGLPTNNETSVKTVQSAITLSTWYKNKRLNISKELKFYLQIAIYKQLCGQLSLKCKLLFKSLHFENVMVQNFNDQVDWEVWKNILFLKFYFFCWGGRRGFGQTLFNKVCCHHSNRICWLHWYTILEYCIEMFRLRIHQIFYLEYPSISYIYPSFSYIYPSFSYIYPSISSFYPSILSNYPPFFSNYPPIPTIYHLIWL